MEVAIGTPSPTVDPSVRTVLIGHSMGGIVAAELVIALAAEEPIYTEDGIQKSEVPPLHVSSLMFPYVQGVLAFDTPYLGISPGVVAHSAEGRYNEAQAAYSSITGLTTAIWGGNKAGKSASAASSAVTAPSAGAASGGWGKWGKVAMAAGAVGAVAAGGAAAWANRDQISSGWSWASSHLEFVGCLARGEELKKRVTHMVQLNEKLGVGFANLYTRLGQGATARTVSVVGTVLGKDRTFCNLPKKMAAGDWMEAPNEKASDETGAHMSKWSRLYNCGITFG